MGSTESVPAVPCLSPSAHHLQCLHFTPNIMLFWQTWQTCDSQDLVENLQAVDTCKRSARPGQRRVPTGDHRETGRTGSTPEPGHPLKWRAGTPRATAIPRHSDFSATKSSLPKLVWSPMPALWQANWQKQSKLQVHPQSNSSPRNSSNRYSHGCQMMY